MKRRLFPFIVSLAALLMPPCVRALQPERLRLPGESGHQVYNYQEQGPWRVWARSEAGFKQSRIWLQRRDADGRWGEAAAWALSDARFRDSDPFLAADGRRLLFISDRSAEGPPLKQLDLFESRWDGQTWTAPTRLPEALQSPAYELGPEQFGDRLWLASYRGGALAIHSSRAGEAPQALPAPVNEDGAQAANSDPTLSPDGRYLLWWSARSGNGDLYLAERLADGRYGPALRLPAPVNSEDGFEFTPWISADGQWLHYASTRASGEAGDAGEKPGLAKLYRVRWPELLQVLGPAAQAASQAELDAAVSAFWRALSHGAHEAADTATLRRLLHPQALIWGSLQRDRSSALMRMTAEDFLAAMSKPDARPMRECELAREQRRYGAMAQVYSRVRSDREAGSAPYTGVNSLQWHWGVQGWQLLSLHFALDLPGEKLSAEGSCLG